MIVTAITSFVHGAYNAVRGQSLDIPNGIAEDLRKAGFVFEPADDKQAQAGENKRAPEPKNKAAKVARGVE